MLPGDPEGCLLEEDKDCIEAALAEHDEAVATVITVKKQTKQRSASDLEDARCGWKHGSLHVTFAPCGDEELEAALKLRQRHSKVSPLPRCRTADIATVEVINHPVILTIIALQSRTFMASAIRTSHTIRHHFYIAFAAPLRRRPCHRPLLVFTLLQHQPASAVR